MTDPMTETQESQEPDAQEPTDPNKGRLVLATGAIVSVPAEGVAVATHHYDDRIGATVPVVSRFVLDD